MNDMWTLPPYAAHFLSDDNLFAVTKWMTDNNMVRATTQHLVTVNNNVITYGRDDSPPAVRAAQRDIVTVTRPMLTPPPPVQLPDLQPDELDALIEVFTKHEWSAGFGGVCVDCSRIEICDGNLWCRRDDAASWPCETVREAMRKAGLSVPGEPDRPIRILGDCLSERDNERVFGLSARESA
jgi:hypothetical protein